MSTVPGIYKKLHAIMSEANYIQKDKRNEFHRYSYASEAAIKEKIHELFVKHGVIPVFSAVNHFVAETAPTEKGKRQYRTTLDLAYTFYDIEDGSSVNGTIPGSGIDGEDKGTYKAITGALKYCLTSQFIIPTGDDPENEEGEKPKREAAKPANKQSQSTTIGAPPPRVEDQTQRDIPCISEAQKNRFIAIYSKNKWADDDVKKLLADFGIHSRAAIPRGRTYENLCAIVEKQSYAEYLDFKTNAPATV